MTKVIIDRAKWDRGEGSEGQLLVHSVADKFGCRCALGWVAAAVGVPDDHIRGVAFLEHTERALNDPWPSSIVREVAGHSGRYPVLSSVGQRIMSVNDDNGITGPEREAELARLFAEAGLELEFVGEGKP